MTAPDELIDANVEMAREYSARLAFRLGIDRDEAVGDGLVALILAAGAWDPARCGGRSFISFAKQRLRWAIIDQERRRRHIVGWGHELHERPLSLDAISYDEAFSFRGADCQLIAEAHEALRRAGCLPMQQRTVVALRILGYRQFEIASALRLSRQRVRAIEEDAMTELAA